MSNERKQIMPPHCGNCIFHDWEESASKCRHPCQVSEEGIRQEVADLATDGGMSSSGIAESLLEDAMTDQEWQEYDHVCDNWRGRECASYPERGKEERRVRDAARTMFAERIASLMPATGEE